MPSKGLSIAIYFFISLALGPVVRRNAGFLDSGVITKLPIQSPKGLRHTWSTTSYEATTFVQLVALRAQLVALGPVVVFNTHGLRPSCNPQYTHGLRPSCCSQYTHGLRPSCESQAFAAACLGRPPPRSFPLSMGCWESPLQQVGSRPSCCPQYTHGLRPSC